MRRIELLAGMLDAEAQPHEIGAVQQIYSSSIPFWTLCLEARKQLMCEQKNKPVEVKAETVVAPRISSSPSPLKT